MDKVLALKQNWFGLGSLVCHQMAILVSTLNFLSLGLSIYEIYIITLKVTYVKHWVPCMAYSNHSINSSYYHCYSNVVTI